jgi:hypothetical protein
MEGNMGSERFKECFEVRYRDQNIEGVGVVRNLSLGGALIQADREVKPHTRLTLELAIPDLPAPLLVSCAEVRWVLGYLMGLQFVRVEAEMYQQLAAYLSRGRNGSLEAECLRAKAA